MNTLSTVSTADLTALAAYIDGELEGAAPPIPADAVLRLAAVVLAGATR
jgi:hypothetical protein